MDPAISFSNLTEDTAKHFRESLFALERCADTWPVMLAYRPTRDETAIGGPPEGTMRAMLVCLYHDCLQCIAVLGEGPKDYSINSASIRSNAARHIKQCHEEAIDG